MDDFIKNFADQFEMTDLKEIKSDTIFKDLDEWDSLMTLSIIGMIQNKYKVKITGGEIRDLNTIEDLYNLVVSRKNG
jgi:acyl carrier protein